LIKFHYLPLSRLELVALDGPGFLAESLGIRGLILAIRIAEGPKLSLDFQPVLDLKDCHGKLDKLVSRKGGDHETKT
jgi:hypothetical protein